MTTTHTLLHRLKHSSTVECGRADTTTSRSCLLPVYSSSLASVLSLLEILFSKNLQLQHHIYSQNPLLLCSVCFPTHSYKGSKPLLIYTTAHSTQALFSMWIRPGRLSGVWTHHLFLPCENHRPPKMFTNSEKVFTIHLSDYFYSFRK